MTQIFPSQHKIRLIFTFMLLVFFAGVQFSPAEDLSRQEKNWLKKKKEIVFISQTHYPPFEFIDDNGNRQGMCIELARWIATEFGFQATFRDATFEYAQKAVLEGGADILTSLFYSEKRDLKFDFSSLTWEVPALIFVRAERPDITTLEDLNGKTIAIQKGDYAHDFLIEKGIRFATLSTLSFDEAVNKVLDLEADAVIGDQQIVLYSLFSRGLVDQVKSVGKPLYVGRNSMAAAEGSGPLIDIIEKGVRNAHERGIFEQITQKWTGTKYGGDQGSWLEEHANTIVVCVLLLAVIIVSVIFWNLNLRRAVENRTREVGLSEEKFRNLVESSSDLIWETDRDFKFTYVSPNAAQLMGYAPNELIGQSVFSFYTPESTEQAQANSRRLQNNPRPFSGLTNPIIHKDGRKVFFESSGVPFFDDKGIFTGYRGINRDITAKREADDVRNHLEKKLQQAQKMEAIGQMAGGVAHDLNNILSGVVTYPDLLISQMADEDPLIKPLKAIREAGERAAAVVADLLTVARGVAAVMEVINLNMLLDYFQRTPEFLKIKVNHPRQDFIFKPAKELLNVKVSPAHIQKCLLNLLLNAAEAGGEEGRIEISTENRYLEKSDPERPNLEGGDYVLLSIADNGSGIAAEDIEHIFEPFYTKKKMGRSGTGLGLTVVWNTIRDYGGEIFVRSWINQGTTFQIWLPATRETSRNQVREDDNIQGRGETVLVVDDESSQREIASGILESLGYEACTASSGSEAVYWLRSNQADILLLDMIMDPGIDGLATYQEILTFRPEQKVIMVSGFSQSEKVDKALELGARLFLKKPYLRKDLGQAIKKILNG